MIKKIVTRDPNLECGFFAALISIQGVREKLGITAGEDLSWEFISTNSNNVKKPSDEPGVVHFNVGGGRWDQHGRAPKRSLCEICSLDLVRGDYDFLKERPWLVKVYELVRENDLRGTRISGHPYNLREITTGLTVRYQNKPEVVLQFLTVAFYSVFALCSASVNIKEVFNPKKMIEGVGACAPKLVDWFKKSLNEGHETIVREWERAKEAVQRSEECLAFCSVSVPAINIKVNVIEIRSDSVKSAPAARNAGYHIVIQNNSDGHAQVHGGGIKVGEGRKRLDFGPVARELRFWESKFRGVRIAPNQDWERSGCVIGTGGQVIPWYLPEFRTSVYNGTLSSKDVPPTKFHPRKLFNIVCKALPKCRCLPDE